MSSVSFRELHECQNLGLCKKSGEDGRKEEKVLPLWMAASNFSVSAFSLLHKPHFLACAGITEESCRLVSASDMSCNFAFLSKKIGALC